MFPFSCLSLKYAIICMQTMYYLKFIYKFSRVFFSVFWVVPAQGGSHVFRVHSPQRTNNYCICLNYGRAWRGIPMRLNCVKWSLRGALICLSLVFCMICDTMAIKYLTLHALLATDTPYLTHFFSISYIKIYK